MKTISTDRMISLPESDAVAGRVRWVPAKSLWTLAMLITAVVGAPLTFSWDALALFLITTAITICGGHSVGMHRLLIHRSFEAPKWLERLLVYLGTLVGMAGPFGMIAAHDIRDWAQRQRECHDLYAHRKGFFRDAWWQMHCVVDLKHPPRFAIEQESANDRFHQFVERTWMLQQAPWAILFFAMGGFGWVIWGIALRITMSLHGHWLVGHFAHRRGQQNWAVDGVAVQGYNIPNVSLLTFGEGWHGNHHAYPGSARLGLEDGELDPGWWLIKTLEFLGFAWNIKQPEQVGNRKGLHKVNNRNRRYPKKLSLFMAWITATIVGLAQFWLIPLAFDLGAAPGLGDVLLLMQLTGSIAFLYILILVVPAIRLLSKDAEKDLEHSLWYYMGQAIAVVAVSALFGLFLLLPFAVLPALAAGLVFGILNKRAIKQHLARTAMA
jgi:stearoyl-CoA desaturase (delta-9 desaturase)